MITYYSHREQDLKNSLVYIPCEVKRKLNEHEKPILIFTTHDRFGYSSAPKSIPYVIIVNDAIFPNGHTREDRMYRFFVFTVLHEVAHVYMDITGTPIEDQEESQANKLAEDWYNEHANNQGLDSLSYDSEIKATQIEIEKAMFEVANTIAASLKCSMVPCEEEANAQQVSTTASVTEAL